ncbi:hypothetical protein [Brachybacterium atlanticum]|uniref:hypothetical protein n=1 Tax=Brachybacterium atlanticum TaxID=2911888 RepID=UPI0021E00A77|nr:hypothetical protein [Brachybacterium atlanticum]
MTAFQGMNTAEVTDLAGRFTERAESLSTLLESLSTRVGAVVGTDWIGPDAKGFATAFDSSVRGQLTTAAESLRTRGGDLDAHVEEQEDGSALAGSQGGSEPAAPTGGPAPMEAGTSSAASFLGADWGDVSFGEFWQNLKENIGIDGVVGGITGDLVGSYVGASPADSTIDTFLD